MSDDRGMSRADAPVEDAFSTAFRQRWSGLDSGQATSSVRRDPTSPLPMADTAKIPAPSVAAPPPESARPARGKPAEPDPGGTPGHLSPGEPYPTYGLHPAPPRPGDPYPSYDSPAQPPQAGPSAAVLIIISAVTMGFSLLLIGLPSLVVGLLAAGSDDAAAKRRRVRLGWIVYAVNWGFFILAGVLLTMAVVVGVPGLS